MANEFIARKGIISLGDVTVTGSITATGGITISGSITSASYTINASYLNNSGSGEFVPTGSFNTFSSSILTYTGSANSRFSSIESTTASLNSASGSAITRLNALEVTSGSNITRISALEVASGSAITRLNALEVTSGSNITRISALEVASGSAISRLSSLEARTGSYATTGSNTFIGNQTITGSILGSGSLTINGCITATGQIVAQTINVQQVTSSIVYSCGSNTFGTTISNTQTMTGSVFITGSLNTIGNACVTSICSPSIVGGTVSGTTGTFSSNAASLTFGANDTVEKYMTIRFSNGDFFVGGTSVQNYIYGAGSRNLALWTNSTQRFLIDGNGVSCFACQVCVTGNADTAAGLVVNNTSGASGTCQHYINFTAGASTIGRIFRGNGVSGVVANGLNIDNFDGFQVRLNQLGGSGGTFNILGGNVCIGGQVRITTNAEYQLDVQSSTNAAGASIRRYTAGAYAYDVYETPTRHWRTGLLGGSYYTIYDQIALTDRFIIDTSGFVGINETTPSTYGRLTVNTGTSCNTTSLFALGYGTSLSNLVLRNNYTRANGILNGIEFRDSSNEVQASIYACATGANNQSVLIFGTNNGTGGNGLTNATERMRITNAGNVGIGLTNPVDGLDVQMALRVRCNTPGFTNACNSLVIDYVNTSIFGSAPMARYFSIGCTSVGAGHQFIVGTPAVPINALYLKGDGTSCFTGQVFAPSAIITGFVGIGTTSPCSSFVLHVTQTCSAGLANMSFDNTAGVPCDTGTQGTILRFRTASSDANMRTIGAIASYAMKNIGSGVNNHGDLRFYTGVEGEVCERMRIASNGLIGINNTTPVAPLQIVCTPGSFYGIIETTACTTGTAKHFRVHKPNCVEYGIGILNDNSFHISVASTFPTTTQGFTMTSSGNVGIGITTPCSQLDVRGTITNSCTAGNRNYTIDTAHAKISIASGGYVDFCSMSGMVLVNNWTNGAVTAFLVGGGSTAVMGTVTGTAGAMFYNSTTAGYRWCETLGSTANYGFQVFRTRDTA